METSNLHKTIIATKKSHHSTFILFENGIVEVHSNDETIYDVEMIKEVVNEVGKLTGGKKCKQITVAGIYTSVTKEGRDFMASDEAVKYTIAEAFVIQSLAQRILGNFYLKFNRPKVPTKIFTDKQKAEAWLISIGE